MFLDVKEKEEKYSNNLSVLHSQGIITSRIKQSHDEMTSTRVSTEVPLRSTSNVSGEMNIVLYLGKNVKTAESSTYSLVR